MNASSFPKCIVLAFAIVVLSAPAWASPRVGLEQIVVFGTSVSDPGNAYALFGGTGVPPYDTLSALRVPPCDQAYAKGGHHLSNGATWIEQLANPLGLAQVAGPAFRGSNDGATNYAVCGARAREVPGNVGLPAQVSAFLNDFDGAAPPEALYVVEMGGNDIRDAVEAYGDPGKGDPGEILTAAVTTIGNEIGALYFAGARKFLVWRAPDIGLTPASLMADQIYPGTAFLATSLSEAFNSGLDGAVASLSGLPGIEIRRLDSFAVVQDLVAHPEDYGLTVVDQTCVTPNVPPYHCEEPDEYLFWDGIHPTRAGHALLRHEAAVALGLE